MSLKCENRNKYSLDPGKRALLTIFLEFLVALDIDLGASRFKRKPHFIILPFVSFHVALSKLIPLPQYPPL